MFMSIDAMAQWAEPTPPELQEVNATNVESGKTYYIKNVGAGQFITGANSWSAQISLTTAGINSDMFDNLSPAFAIMVEDFTATSGSMAGATGVLLKLNGTYTVNGAGGARTFTNTRLFRDSEESGFMDWNNQDRGYIWKITKAESGYFYIQTAEGDSNYPDAATQYAGWDNSLGEIESDPETGELLDGSVSTAVQFNLTGELESDCIEWMFIPAEEFFAQKEAYNYRVKLYEKYQETVETAEIEGLDVDYYFAESIYNKENSSVDELKAAITDLTYQVNVARFKKELEGATPDNPIDATDIVLVNASLDGNINGWDNTFKSRVTAVNCGYQGASYTNNGTTLTELGSATNEADQPAFLNGYIEAWRPNEQDPHHIGDAELSQTIYGLPTGVYKLTCDVISVQQGSYFPNPVTGVKLFIATDTGKEIFQEVATGNGNPEHFSVTFTCHEGVKAITIGLKTENTTANWIGADNFRIYYYGESEFLKVNDTSIVVNESNNIDIELTNEDTNLVAFQMDLTLPEGVSLDKTGCSLSSRITDEKQALTIGKLESGAYRLTSTSLSLTPISGKSGALLTLKVTSSDDCEGGEATISNIRFSTSDSEKIIMSDMTFNIEILKTFNVNYMLDGEIYKSVETVYKTPLTHEAEPTKDGYTFGGWSELPETMPNHDVEVTGRFYLYGDVNTDEEVDVVDVVDIARYVVATPSVNFREKLADLNYDSAINIADAVTLVNHIAGDQNFVKAEKNNTSFYDYSQCQLQLLSGEDFLSLRLSGDADFTAFQFEVEVPENTDISAMRINGMRNNGHKLLFNKVTDNRYRVAALSLTNATFKGEEGELLNIGIEGLHTDDASIHDIHFVTTKGQDITFDSLYISGIETGFVNVGNNGNNPIYDLQGRRRSTLQRGLNIVGGKTILNK